MAITLEDLQSYRKIKNKVRIMAKQLDELQHLAGTPGDSPCPRSAKAYNQYQKLKAEYSRQIDKALDLLTEIEISINSLSEEEQELMRLHYVQGLTWEAVAIELDYSSRQTYRLYSQAADKLGLKTCH